MDPSWVLNLTCNATSLMCVCCIITRVTTLVNARHYVAWHLLSMQVALSVIALPHPTPYIRAQMNLIDIENGYRTRQHGFASAGTKRIDSLAELPRQSSLYCLVAEFVRNWTQSRDWVMNVSVSFCLCAIRREGKSLQKASPRRPCVTWHEAWQRP